MWKRFLKFSSSFDKNLNSNIVSLRVNLLTGLFIGLALRFISIVALIFLSEDNQYDLK